METPLQVEPTRLEAIPERLADTLAEVTRLSTLLPGSLHPTTVAGLAELLRLTNRCYSNLIEGNVTRPRDIERAIDELNQRGRDAWGAHAWSEPRR